jgi:hypothetical protein
MTGVAVRPSLPGFVSPVSALEDYGVVPEPQTLERSR